MVDAATLHAFTFNITTATHTTTTHTAAALDAIVDDASLSDPALDYIRVTSCECTATELRVAVPHVTAVSAVQCPSAIARM